jgi:ubiquitin carboxyl-terminal hydrolase 4/11/15
MGGAADLPQRSSSPLKRRASDLEDSDVPSSQRDDVDMVPVPASDPPAPTEPPDSSTGRQRAQSVDMLRNEAGPAPSNGSALKTEVVEQKQDSPNTTDPQNGAEVLP